MTEQDIEDDDEDAFLNLDERFIDSGWGGECLRDTEDIDFEFVYALHTFVATVEGQANATKGDREFCCLSRTSMTNLLFIVNGHKRGFT